MIETPVKYIYIIGIDHKVQHDSNGTCSATSTYRDYLHDTIAHQSISLVAEESSTEAQATIYNVTQSIAQEICRAKGVSHLLIDPNTAERQALGIKFRYEVATELGISHVRSRKDEEPINERMQPYDRLREKEWLKRIGQAARQPVLVICGYDHLSTFSSLASSEGYKCSILQTFSGEHAA